MMSFTNKVLLFAVITLTSAPVLAQASYNTNTQNMTSAVAYEDTIEINPQNTYNPKSYERVVEINPQNTYNPKLSNGKFRHLKFSR